MERLRGGRGWDSVWVLDSRHCLASLGYCLVPGRKLRLFGRDGGGEVVWNVGGGDILGACDRDFGVGWVGAWAWRCFARMNADEGG